MIPLTEIQNLNTDAIPTYSVAMNQNNRIVLLAVFTIIIVTSTLYLVYNLKNDRDEKYI
jgi:hypothetical protein